MPIAKAWNRFTFLALLTTLSIGAGGLHAADFPRKDLKAGTVIDVYLFGGQSNMEGVGITELIDPSLRRQEHILLAHSKSMNSGEPADEWTTLRPASSRPAWFGPEIGFGQRMTQLMPEANMAIIKHGVSGTSLGHDWNPNSTTGPDGYGVQLRTFLDLVKTSMAKLRQQGLRPRIRGMLWQQGERDAREPTMYPHYAANLTKLIKVVRKELDAPDMVFVYGRVLPVNNEIERKRYPYRDEVRQQELDVDENSGKAEAVKGACVVLTDDLTTHGQHAEGGRRTNDFTHFNTAGQLGLGRRFAERMYEELEKQ